MENNSITQRQKNTYAGMWIMKMIDLGPKQGGFNLEVPIPPEYVMIEEIMDNLIMDGYVEIDAKKAIHKMTDKGINYIGFIIDEAEKLVDEFDDEDTEDMLEELYDRNLDVFRVRFLWGLYTGEFDDIVLFQEKRGFKEIEKNWANFITSEAFYNNLALDI